MNLLFALALLCGAPEPCDKSTAVRWWRGDTCATPTACLMLATERAARTGIEPRGSESWKLSMTRDEVPMEGGR